MSFLSHSALCCPLDGQPLEIQGNCLRCSAGHSFDIARQGYVNLLGAGDKRTRDPGDNKAMISARREFLNAGYYQPIADKLGELVRDVLEDRSAGGLPLLVDAGCGEGYYLQRLQDSGLASASLLGFDISKWAMRAAARRLEATWLVASNRNIPLADHSADILLSLFGFPDYREFLRVLRPGGTLLLVNAGPRHLLALRETIYPEVRRSGSGQCDRAREGGFLPQSHSALAYDITLPDQDSIGQLLAMTPHLFRASAAGKQRASALNELALDVDVVFDLLRAPAA